jgi:hypothetical protein
MASPKILRLPQQPQNLERLQLLVQRAQQGDEGVVPELRQALDANPEIWERYGDLALQAQGAWLELICGPNLLLRESLVRKIEEMEREVLEAKECPLQRLLAKQVVACWLQVQYADAIAAQLRGSSPAQYTIVLRRQNSAQRRYLQSIRTLATVRTKLRPAPSPLDLLGSPVAETAARSATTAPRPRLAAALNPARS